MASAESKRSYGTLASRMKSLSKLWHPGLVLVLVSGWYLVATLPNLSNYPLLGWAQMGIAAPAHSLAEEGVYGNPLFTGFHRSELRNYEYMPAYPLLVACAYELFGLGVWQARVVSVLCGWLTVMLIYLLGRQLYGSRVGLIAAILAVTLRLGLLAGTSGVALLDFARLIRYDILVPVGVLAACCCFVAAMRQPRPRLAALGFLASGLFAGLATLAHVYGVFILVVLAGILWWQRSLRVLRSTAPYWIAAGWLIAMLPWILYVLQDTEAYLGQMSRHENRFDVFDPGFYWRNLSREIWRYGAWSGGSLEAAFLRPRVGLWVVLMGIPASTILLLRSLRSRPVKDLLSDRILFLAFPVLQLCLALFIAFKRYYYTLLVLPFLILQLAYLADLFQRRVSRRGGVARFVLPTLLVLIVAESAAGIAGRHRVASQTTPYLEISKKIAEVIPAGSRVLITQPWWLGLTHFGHETLFSVNLLFLYRDQPIDEIMGRLDPDIVVIEEYFLEGRSTDPRATGNPEARRSFQDLAGYLARHCSREVARIPDLDYGTIGVYDCQ